MKTALLSTLFFVAGASEGQEPGGQPVEWGTERYVEYRPGELPLVLSVPHGGSLVPDSVADRTSGTLQKDVFTQELADELCRAIAERTGARPHVVLCHLHRTKLDANRSIDVAAQGDPVAERAWREFHAAIERASARVTERHGRGLYIDLHGQSHPEGWIEWGYAHSARDLAQPDEGLGALSEKSTLRALARDDGARLVELIRGEASLGGLLEAAGYAGVPSPKHPHPAGGNYYDGGYNVRRHGSRGGGTVDGVQLEVPRPLRRSKEERRKFAAALADGIVEYFRLNYELDLAAVAAHEAVPSEGGGGG